MKELKELKSPALCMACKGAATLGIWAGTLNVEITLCKPCIDLLQPKVGA